MAVEAMESGVRGNPRGVAQTWGTGIADAMLQTPMGTCYCYTGPLRMKANVEKRAREVVEAVAVGICDCASGVREARRIDWEEVEVAVAPDTVSVLLRDVGPKREIVEAARSGTEKVVAVAIVVVEGELHVQTRTFLLLQNHRIHQELVFAPLHEHQRPSGFREAYHHHRSCYLDVRQR